MFRLYVDESGDHGYTNLDNPARQYLCLVGCLFELEVYQHNFQPQLEALKAKYFRHDPDEPVILHREELMNRRGPFRVLLDTDLARAFDTELLELIRNTDFRLIAVVIDKRAHLERYREAAWHPYHYCLTVLLERYCGYLNHFNRTGDVLAESRGRNEDLQLKEAYKHVHSAGTYHHAAAWFRKTLTSHEIKIKPKSKNVAGLQLADIIAHPVKQEILSSHNRIEASGSRFGQQLCQAVSPKYNRHLYTGRVEGYGRIFLA